MSESNLDALIRELDRDASDQSQHLPDVTEMAEKVQSQSEGDNIPLVEVPQLPPDPGVPRSPVQRSPIIAKYISSSSARRRIVKPTNCKYCNQEHDRASLGLHLEQNERCKILYSRQLHVKSVEAILCLTFECLFCEDRAPRLFHHLERKEDCKQKYLTRFDASNSREAVDKVLKMKRTGFKSRRSLSRAIENESAKKKRLDQMTNDPPEVSLNSHLTRNLFSNFKTCIGCLCNVTFAEEVTNDSDCVKSGSHSIENKSYLSRMGKFWLCNSCSSEIPYSEPGPQIVMRSQVIDDKLVFLPVKQEDIGNLDFFQTEDSKKIFIIMPCSTESLKVINADSNMRSLNGAQIQRVLYSTEPFDENSAALLYEHQLMKYKRAVENTEHFTGKVADIQNHTLSAVQACSQEKRIVGSDSWRRGKIQELDVKRKQLGKLCLKVSVMFPFDDSQSLATHLIQRGHHVSVTLQGCETGEMNRTYFVHTGHDVSSPCIENCPKISLGEYLDQDGVSVKPDVGTYVSSVDQLINSLITNVFKCPSSKIVTDDYHFNISYDTEGQVIMEGFIWPTCFRDYNLLEYEKGLSFEKIDEIRTEALEILRKHISSSSNIRILKSQFNMTETEAKKIAEKVEKYQIHCCQSEDCTRCRNAPLPSLQYLFKQFPDSPENIATSKQLLKLLKTDLSSRSPEYIKSTATVQWLESIWERVEVSEAVENDFWRIILEEEVFYFKLDERLVQLIDMFEAEPFQALYQYCIGIGELDQLDEFIMKRLTLIDCFTDPFIPLFLQAADSPIKVTAMKTFQHSDKWSFENPDYLGCYEAGLNFHVKVSLAEAYSLIDNKKLRTRSSRPSEFVFTGSSPSILLKKVKQANENTFRNESDGSFYELQETIVTRYFKRLNGRDLLLSEVACHYDYIGKDDSASKYDVFHDKLDKIPSSEIPSLTGGENLPELIICHNKDVLAVRKKSKILIFKTFEADTYDNKFSQVLLFGASDVHRFEDLTPEIVDVKYEEVCEESQENKIKARKRSWHRSFIVDRKA